MVAATRGCIMNKSEEKGCSVSICVHNFEVWFNSAVVGKDRGCYTKKDRQRKQKKRAICTALPEI